MSFSDEPTAEVVAVLMRDGEEALAHNRFTEAYARFSEALRLDWNHPRAYELLQKIRLERDHTLLLWEGEARHAESRSEPGKAKWIYERIIAEDSTRADLIDRVRRLGRQRDAADCVRSGMEKFIADDFAGAQLDFEQALAISPKDTLAAQYRERTRQKITASGSLAAIQADPEAWGRYLDALRKLREGDLAAAERLWSDLLTKYPGNENIRSNLEQVRRRLGTESANADDE
jgi:TolA-binding protein